MGALFLTKLVLVATVTLAPTLPEAAPPHVPGPPIVPPGLEGNPPGPPITPPGLAVDPPGPPITPPGLTADPPARPIAPADPPAAATAPAPAAPPSPPVATPVAPPAPDDPAPRRPARAGRSHHRAPTPTASIEPAGAGQAIRLRPVADTSARPAATPAPRRADARPARQSGLAGDLVQLVEALPAALLWSLLGMAALALGLAANAYRQSRRGAALEAQRAGLLDDIGLLSGALLPPVPAFEDLIVSAAYRPADGPAGGGDFYDVFALDDRRVGVLLGDVSGHGRASLRQAALARFTLRTLLSSGLTPGEALAQADGLLERDLRPDFVTVIAAVYDRETATLTYAKAGHAPPIVLGAPHDPDAEASAPPIGLATGASWPEFHLRLDDGVSVCLVTDGLEDAKRGTARLGRDAVVALAAAHRRPDAERLLGDVGALADCVADDTAAVVLSRA